jgi:hypothetical protein
MDDPWLEFDVAVAAWRLGSLPLEELPDAAVNALDAGCDTPSLVQLAGMEHASWSEIEPVVARAFADRGREFPDDNQAVKAVADSIARQMVAGTLDPEAGARKLGRDLAWRVNGQPACEDLMPFTALWGHLDAVEAGRLNRDEIRKAMVSEAEAMLERGGVR